MVSKSQQHRNAVFRAIADPTRRDILGILRHGQQTVGAIAGNFRMSRPAISKHLRQLHSAGLVSMRKEGAASYCTLNARPLTLIDEWLHEYQAYWSHNLNRLKTRIEEGQ